MNKEEIILKYGKNDGLDEIRYEIAKSTANSRAVAEDEAFLSIIKLELDKKISLDRSSGSVSLKKNQITNPLVLARRHLVFTGAGIVCLMVFYVFYQYGQISQIIKNPKHKSPDIVGGLNQKLDSVMCKDIHSSTCKEHREFIEKLKQKLDSEF